MAVLIRLLIVSPFLFICASTFAGEYIHKDRTVMTGQRWRSDPEVLYAGAKHRSCLPPLQRTMTVKKDVSEEPVALAVDLGSGEHNIDGVIVRTWYSEE